MNAAKPVSNEGTQQDDAAAQPEGENKNQPAAGTQPPPSGTGGAAANRGSPAAPVMKQFAKTEAEGTGRP